MSAKLKLNRSIVSWCFYDWANSAYVLTVITGFFPIFFKKFWCGDFDASFSTIRLNLGNAGAGLVIALTAPFLGAFADAGAARKKMLMSFMAVGVCASILLALIGKEYWMAALAVFCIGSIGFSSANVFYDSLLPSVAEESTMTMISSLGYALGYLGCGILFAVNILMVRNPARFGFVDKTEAVRASFLSVALWWIVFSIPLFLWVSEQQSSLPGRTETPVKDALQQLRTTARDILSRREVWMFLLAYWLYIDGVHSFIRAATDLGLSIGIDEGGLLRALLLVQFTAFPFAWLFGHAAQRFGLRNALLTGIVLYAFVACAGPILVRTTLHFTLFAMLQAIPLGALQALSRSYFARLIPPEKAAEYFGFFSLLGKFAVVIGPAQIAIVVVVARAFGASSACAARLGAASLTVFFLSGAALLILAKPVEPEPENIRK